MVEGQATFDISFMGVKIIMEKPVKLQNIIDGMEMQFDDTHIYLNLSTGEIISVTDEDFRIAEDDESFDHLPDWQRDHLVTVIDVLENIDNYEELPTKFEIHEYNMMEDFCYDVESQKHSNTLLNAIRGRGAFRRFKDMVYDLGIEEKWYDFRARRYKQIAIDWCKDHSIKYID